MATSTQTGLNTVPAKDQLARDHAVSMEHGEHGGLRLLFVGNSITRHAPKADIGWDNDWGMAASAQEKDYVHLVMQHVRQQDARADYCIAQVASWEREYWNEQVLHEYEAAVNFNPDIILIKVGANVPAERNKDYPFGGYFRALLDFLNPQHTARVIVATDFFAIGVIDDAMRQVARERAYPLVELGQLGKRDDMKAIGLFAHDGVANHPGDLGMATIAAALEVPLDILLANAR